ncbi:MAG TPA: exopolysaccharide biosynthesis polyprenyl glycosylphosphotransferase, partial [Rhizobiales bacterium]|nr:exopolysaccharide biosynthesis polyprenyl glycosylphosphotransferase [Hyphomicrobiales bacterium]
MLLIYGHTGKFPLETGGTIMGENTLQVKSSYIDREVVQRLLKIADFGVVFVGSTALLFRAMTDNSPELVIAAGFIALCITLSTMLVLRYLGLYNVKSLVNPLYGLLASTGVSFVTGSLAFLILSTLALPLSKVWLFGWLALVLTHFTMTRMAVAAWAMPLAENGAFRQRIAIVGGGKVAEDAINILEKSSNIDVEIVGLFDDRNDERSPESVKKYAKLGKIEDLAGFARENRIDLIIVAVPMTAEARLLQILKRLWELPTDIRIAAHTSKLKLSPRAYTNLGNLPLMSVFDRPVSGWSWFMKDAVDRVLAAVFIVLLSPVMAATWLAVRYESAGPAIFKQKRFGFNNELVEVFKFRSMYTDMGDANASKLVTKGDPRVTKVGRFIRKTSIDELPQLFNVLTGQLSLVGPRPHATQAKAGDDLYDQV